MAKSLERKTKVSTASVEDFIDAWVERPADYPVEWDGAPITAATLAGVLLGEVVMHGYDIAYALGMPWPIDPGHAVLILGAYGPLFPHIVDAETTAGHTAGYAIDLGGGPILTVRFTGGVIGLEPPGMGRRGSIAGKAGHLPDGGRRAAQPVRGNRAGADERHRRTSRTGGRVQEPLRRPVAAAHR